VNITNKDAVAVLPEQIISKHGSVDGLINNAGIIQPFVRIKDLDCAAIERVMNVNFYGTLLNRWRRAKRRKSSSMASSRTTTVFWLDQIQP
jgi:NAD(P)-dependent dehydrogenase (short-subunit alcohol dehydrogenase family)